MRRLSLACICLIVTVTPSILAQPTPVGNDFRVNTETTQDQSNPSVAADAQGNFIVVWRSLFQDGDGLGIFGQRFQADGTPSGGEVQLNDQGAGSQSQPAVTMAPNGQFAVVWTNTSPTAGPSDGDGSSVFGRRFDAGGAALGGDFQIHTYITGDQTRPRAAMTPDGSFTVAWMSAEGDGGAEGVFAQPFDAAGSAIGSELAVNTTTVNGQLDPDIAADTDGNFVVVWYDYGFPSPDGDLFGVFGQRYDSLGNPLGTEFQVNAQSTGYQFEPAVARGPQGDFVVVWDSYFQDGDRDGIFARRFDSAGNALSGEIQVNTYTTGCQNNADVAMDTAGGFVVTWQSGPNSCFGGPATDIKARSFDSAGAPLTGELQVNTSGGSLYFPSVASTGVERFVVAWQRIDAGDFEVHARRFTSDTVVADPALVGRWSFDEGTGSVAVNAAANGLDGALESGATWTTGQQGSAALFDGVDALVRVTDPGADSPIDVTDALTLAAWVRPDHLDGSTQVLISKDNAYELEVGKLGATTWDLRLDNQVVATAPTPLEEGVWQHVAVTWDGTDVTFYYNGLVDGSGSFNGTLTPNDDDLGLGARPSVPIAGGPVFHFEGALDEVSIYNRVLSATELATLWLDTAGDFAPPLRSNPAPTSSLAAGTTAASLSLDTDEAATCRYATSAGTRFDDMPSTFDVTGGSAHSANVPVADGVTYAFFVRCRDGVGNTHGDDLAIAFGVGASDLTAGAVATWALDEGTGCTAGDSVLGFDGTLGPACPTNAPGWSTGHDGGAALTFDGVDDRVDVANTPALATPAGLTLSAWVRHAPTGLHRAILDARDSGADGYDLFIDNQSRLLVRVNDKTLTGPSIVADGQWHHVVGTYDGSTLRLYVDGVLDAEQSVGATALNVNADLRLGHHFDSDTFTLAGELSRAALWNRALSSVEVLDLFLATR